MKASWGHLCKTSWRCFENVLKTSWRSLEDIFARRLQNVLKMSWRRFENVLKTSWRRMSKTNILVLIKTSWRRLLKTKTKEVFKTSSSRRLFAGLQRCKINNSFSEWVKISVRVLQGSTLGPLLFNIFINDIFLFLQKRDLANYADDNTMYTSDKRLSTIVDSLRHEFTILSKWFYNDFMVLNPEKCSFMLLGVDDSLQANLVCGDEILENAKH